MTTVAGYGRYKDDPEHVGCPRAQSDMTPCIARDGALAVSDPPAACVGCGERPVKLLRDLQRATDRSFDEPFLDSKVADQLRDLVREVTAP